MTPHPRIYLSLIQKRDEAQAQYYTAFREERRLGSEHRAAVRNLEEARSEYAAALKAVREPVAMAVAAE